VIDLTGAPGFFMRSGLPLILLAAMTYAQAHAAAPASSGESIYRLGILSSGAPLIGERDANTRVTGPEAACAKCHRRSGLGASEGRVIIPPLTAQYLFNVRGRDASQPDARAVLGFIQNRKAYDVSSMARAIRDGVDVGGRKLNYLMPRYKLNDVDMASVTRYLQDLNSAPTPGVDDATLQFATIITPDADVAKRKAMLDVLNQFFADKNEFIRGGIRPMQAKGGVQFRVSRRWKLHVWELTGASDTWRAQLEKKLSAEPVFAVISGIGGGNWAPVHEFCETNRVPCLFPNVDLPVDAENDFYTLYYTKGVLLEAELIADELKGGNSADPIARRRAIQIYRAGDMGAAAAHVLGIQAGRAGFEAVSLPLGEESAGPGLDQKLRDIRATDTVVLWLRPADISALPTAPPPGARIYLSGLMAGLENAPLPAAWRSAARLSYPFDPPDKRKFRMNYPLAWMKVRNVSMVDERVQSNTYLACGILAEQLTSMQDVFVRDYLLERIEDMLSHRVLSGFYPRLSLAPGQRFASKGGYLVHFAASTGTQILADSEWVVP
jgi:hypothetical protein